VRVVNRGAAKAAAPAVEILVDGQVVPAVPGSSLSAALWNAGWRSFSVHPVTGRPRGPLCGMGVCQECLVWLIAANEATGVGEPAAVSETLPPERSLVRSCLEPVRAGLRVRLDLPDRGGETLT
jgi:2Fe-2S iron-sulfur cluster binding domain